MSKIYALQVSPYDAGTAGETDVYIATRDYRTAPGDALAGVLFEGVIDGWSFRRDAVRPGEVNGASLAGRGAVSIAVPAVWKSSGRLAAWLGYGWSGRAFTLYEIDPATGWSGRRVAASGTAASLSQPANDQLLLRFHDPAEDLRRPIQTVTYTGAGGTEGGAELKGRPKPLVFGWVINAPAVPSDPSSLIFDVHDGRIEAIDAVRDNGVDLPASGSNPPPAGHYYADLANGRLVLGSSPDGRVTADVRGHAPGGVWAEDLAAVVREIVTTFGGLADPGGLDTAAFTQLATDRPGAVGFSTGTSPIDISEILDRMVGGAGGSWYFTRAGKFTLAVLRPTTATASSDSEIVAVIDAYRVLRGSGERIDAPLPPSRVDAQYAILGVVQREDELASGVTAANRQAYSTPARLASASSATVQAKHLRAVPLPLASYAYGETLATTIAEDLRDVLEDLALFAAETDAGFGAIEIFDQVWISHADYGLPAAGAAARVLGVEEDETGIVRLEVATT